MYEVREMIKMIILNTDMAHHNHVINDMNRVAVSLEQADPVNSEPFQLNLKDKCVS